MKPDLHPQGRTSFLRHDFPLGFVPGVTTTSALEKVGSVFRNLLKQDVLSLVVDDSKSHPTTRFKVQVGLQGLKSSASLWDEDVGVNRRKDDPVEVGDTSVSQVFLW